ncbi:LysR substrate-binding domain-containing protein [Vogesella indigofera]|uniref:LysR substrate-binding domain-containing protein n=1 Tax=Vogesella indigofera TaxID=45465 RepID=UPI00234F1D7C|nr:LysR substrate-binding domain-containing protein [Vogesella indigofera]MDC7712356.1 LysR substrate-binding domain-containing protein [Vogesella indigofera]
MIPELRTFIAVARHGTFAGAGEQIGLTQSAVSSQIKRLEDFLGYKLFDRTGRSAILNEAGSIALIKAEEIVALFSRFCEAPSEENATGTLNIGAISSLQSTVLARALVPIRQIYPKLRIRIVPGLSMHLMDQMDTGQIDIAIVIRPPFGILPDLSWQSLIKEPFVLLVHSEIDGVDWRQILNNQPFIRYERTSYGGRMVDRFLRAENITVSESFEMDELQGIVKMVLQKLGVALLPLSESILPLPSGVRIISLGDYEFVREIGVVRHRQKSNQPFISKLAYFLHQEGGQSLAVLDS